MGDAELGVLMAILVGLLWAGIGVCNSRVGRSGSSIPLYYALTTCASVVLLGLFHVRWEVLLAGGSTRVGELTLVLMPTALLNLLAMALLMQAMRCGHNGFVWTIGQSAMVIPFLASVLMWGERVGALRWLGLALTLVALVLIGLGRRGGAAVDNRTSTWLRIAILGLLFNGIAQTCNTIPSRWDGWTDTANLRPILGALAGCLVTGLLALRRGEAPDRVMVTTALAAATVGVASTVLLFQAMDHLGRAGILAIAYPMAVGVCILGFSGYSALRLREPFGLRGLGVTALGVAGLAFLAL